MPVLAGSPTAGARVDHAAQQVPGQPAALVVELDDLGHFRRAVGLAEVVGLHQLGVRIDGADRAHRQHGGAALDQQGLDEGAVVAPCGYQTPYRPAKRAVVQGSLTGV
jgi:hypothetical protein